MVLTVIIPCFNEKKTIKKIIERIKKQKIRTQIIVVDDFSTDGSREILTKYLKSKIDKLVLHNKNLGKGAAIISAKKFIKGKYTIIQDADLEYNPKDIIKMYNYIKKKNLDVVYGSRVLNKNKFENTKNFTHLIRIWGNTFLLFLFL